MKMTKADKVDAVLALVMVAVLAVIGHQMRGNRLLFTVGFPVVMYALYFWLRRATTAHMEDQHDENVAVFNRQPVMRLLFGFFALGFAALLGLAVSESLRRGVYWDYSTSDDALLISLYALLLGGPCLLLLWGAGPYQVRLDLRRRQYSCTQGLPLIPLTKHGSTDGSVLYILRMRSGQYQVRFRPTGHRWGYLLDTHGTDEAAHAQAWRLADALGLGVESGNQPS